MNEHHVTVRRLIEDEYFLKWIIDSDDACDSFWKCWMEGDPSREQSAELARKLIEESFAFDPQNLDISVKKSIWNDIQQRIDEVQHSSSLPSRKYRGLKYAAACAVAIMAGLSWYIFDITHSPQLAGDASLRSEGTAYAVKQAPIGTKLTFYLEDGTVIKLNSGSSIRYPTQFSGPTRQVYLEGEAFFDVERDPSKPFIVQGGKVSTTVLGTSFNVKAYGGESDIEVAVISGRVVVQGNDIQRTSEEVVLRPTDKAVYNIRDGNFRKTTFDVDVETSWKDGVIYFKDSNFDEIRETLERWYGVKFHMRRKIKEANDFNGRFDNKSLDTVLKGISYTLKFDYQIKDKTVIIE